MLPSRREFLAASAGTLASLSLPAIAQDRPAPRLETLVRSGADDNRVNLVFASEGFEARAMARFDQTIRALSDRLGRHPIFSEYSNFWNVHVLRAPSAKNWDGTGDGSRFGTRAGDGNEGLLVDWAKVRRELAPALPEKHVLALIVHNAEALRSKGGGSPLQGTLATGSDWMIFLHELGHALGLLGDEYPDGGPLYRDLSVNVSLVERPVPWEPMLREGAAGVGVYKVEGLQRTFWKAERACLMGQDLDDLGPVCRWGMVLGLHRHTRLIESSTRTDVVATPANARELTVRFLSPSGHSLTRLFVARRLQDARQHALVRNLTAPQVTRETFSRSHGWRDVRTVPTREGDGVRILDLGPGHHLVAAYAEDRHDWIAADPEGVARDVVAWAVTVPDPE